MQYSIQIPKPCHESWEGMTQAEGGRHCTLCAKTVQDFTDWEPEDIMHYLQQSKTEVCGRFRSAQLDVVIDEDAFIQSVASASIPLYKKIAAIFLLSFGLLQMNYSANAQQRLHNTKNDVIQHNPQHIMGGPMPYKEPQKTTQQKDSTPKPPEQGHTLGIIATPPHKPPHKIKTHKPTHTVGKVAISRVTTTDKNKKQ